MFQWWFIIYVTDKSQIAWREGWGEVSFGSSCKTRNKFIFERLIYLKQGFSVLGPQATCCPPTCFVEPAYIFVVLYHPVCWIIATPKVKFFINSLKLSGKCMYHLL
jgi:hypothetical protein